ncbi:MAG: hypothetical protein HYU02_02870 [Thaumarchaeota archaeon]|nr:hypothetical protein [Nitrososphaerota archaeon]
MGRAISKILPIIMAIVAITGVAGYFLLTQPSRSQGTPEPVNLQQPIPKGDGPQQDPRAPSLRQTAENYIKQFASKDVDGMMTNYIPENAYAEWGGVNAGTFAGKYDGTHNIRILWSSIIANTVNITEKHEGYDGRINGDNADVKYVVYFNGTGTQIGSFEIKTDIIQKYQYINGKWLINNDLWIFRTFKTEQVVEGTVFPLHWRKAGDFSVWNDRAKEIFAHLMP